MKRLWTSSFLILFFLLLVNPLQAQETPTAEDSLRIYRDIEKFSKKSKFTKFIYKLVFKPVIPVKSSAKKKPNKIQPRDIDKYNCRIIRNISIEVTDPFGYSLLDTAQKPHSFVQKKGNSMHIKTRRFIVRNFLFFKPNSEFEAYLVSESERLLRQSGLFRDVIIYPVPAGKSKDSVDVIVRVLDRWSISGQVVATTSAVRVRLTDRNIGGFGHTFRNKVEFDESGFSGYSLRYDINRIGKTYISARLFDEQSSGNTRSSSASVYRPFYSPITKWSYGSSVYSYRYAESLYYNDTLFAVPEVKSRGYDAYVSRSFRLGQMGASFEKNAKFLNLILSARMMHRVQEATVFNDADSLGVYYPLNFYLGMIALSNISFEQSNYIFRFGEVEDIPTGRFAGLIFGFDPQRIAQYTGIRVGTSVFRGHWYYSIIADAGKFHETTGDSRTAFNLRLTSFSPLAELGNWKFRQFFRISYTTGENLPANRFLQLNTQPGLERVNDGALPGYHRITGSLQTQAYAPWSVIGFRFAPVLYLNGGFISNERSTLLQGRMYSSIGIGFIIRNDLLVNSNFQISISVFPNMFGTTDWYRLNDLRTNDFQLPTLQQDLPDFVQFY